MSAQIEQDIGQARLAKCVAAAYRDTAEAFAKWSEVPEYRPYTVPPATDPKAGFAIFYSPAYFRPGLLIVGQNPTNFAGGFKPSLADEPNGSMLAGSMPNENTYFSHEHAFARRLREGFREEEEILRRAVGMNVWHFQTSANASKAPLPLRKFCATTTAALISALEPKVILCIGNPAFVSVPGSRSEVVSIGREVRQFDVGPIRVIGLPHITGSYTWESVAVAMPIAVTAITAYLAGR